MTSLIRDVLFPSAAALGLLIATVAETARAEETHPAQPVVIAASSTVTAAASHDANDDKRTVGERRCEKVTRIGKFRVTRCS